MHWIYSVNSMDSKKKFLTKMQNQNNQQIDKYDWMIVPHSLIHWYTRFPAWITNNKLLFYRRILWVQMDDEDAKRNFSHASPYFALLSIMFISTNEIKSLFKKPRVQLGRSTISLTTKCSFGRVVFPAFIFYKGWNAIGRYFAY